MPRVAFADVWTDAGYQYQENTEDGPMWRHDYFVLAQVGEDVYELRHGFRWRQDADAMAEKVRARRTIDLARWEKIENGDDRTLEERWNDYAQQEWEMARGLRAEGDYQ